LPQAGGKFNERTKMGFFQNSAKEQGIFRGVIDKV